MILTVILGLASAALTTVIVVKVLKDAKKEEKLDKFASVVKAGVDATIKRYADRELTADEVGEIIAIIIKKAKEVF